MNMKLIKTLGLTASLVGAGATLLTEWVNDKKLDEKIDERINERLGVDENEEDEES